MRPEVLPPTSAQRHKPKAFDHGYHSPRYPDAATKGPGFDPLVLEMRTATAGKHVDWVHDAVVPIDVSSIEPRKRDSSPSWQSAPWHAAAAADAASGKLRPLFGDPPALTAAEWRAQGIATSEAELAAERGAGARTDEATIVGAGFGAPKVVSPPRHRAAGAPTRGELLALITKLHDQLDSATEGQETGDEAGRGQPQQSEQQQQQQQALGAAAVASRDATLSRAASAIATQAADIKSRHELQIETERAQRRHWQAQQEKWQRQHEARAREQQAQWRELNTANSASAARHAGASAAASTIHGVAAHRQTESRSGTVAAAVAMADSMYSNVRGKEVPSSTAVAATAHGSHGVSSNAASLASTMLGVSFSAAASSAAQAETTATAKEAAPLPIVLQQARRALDAQYELAYEQQQERDAARRAYDDLEKALCEASTSAVRMSATVTTASAPATPNASSHAAASLSVIAEPPILESAAPSAPLPEPKQGGEVGPPSHAASPHSQVLASRHRARCAATPASGGTSTPPAAGTSPAIMPRLATPPHDSSSNDTATALVASVGDYGETACCAAMAAASRPAGYNAGGGFGSPEHGFGAGRDGSMEAELTRLRAECSALRVKAEGAEARAREAAMMQRDAERNAANAVESSYAANRRAADLKEQLDLARADAGASRVATDEIGARNAHIEAELHGLRSQLKHKREECDHLRSELTICEGRLGAAQAEFGRKELEMRSVRSKALAMVRALRQATDHLAKEHSSAHQVLDTHFRQLEASVDWTNLVVAQKAA